MANETMTLISTGTVGSGGSVSIDLTSIPATYTDLYIGIAIRTSYTTALDRFTIRFNNDAGANYQSRHLTGNGSSASAGTRTSQNELSIEFGITGVNGTANSFGNAMLYIPNYAGSTIKAVTSDSVADINSASGALAIGAGIWNSTAAINRITIDYFAGALGNTLVQYSTASLYGIKKGSGGATVS